MTFSSFRICAKVSKQGIDDDLTHRPLKGLLSRERLCEGVFFGGFGRQPVGVDMDLPRGKGSFFEDASVTYCKFLFGVIGV